MAMSGEAGALAPVMVFALVGALGVGAQWLAWRLRMPAIVLMLARFYATLPVGMVPTWRALIPAGASPGQPGRMDALTIMASPSHFDRCLRAFSLCRNNFKDGRNGLLQIVIHDRVVEKANRF